MGRACNPYVAGVPLRGEGFYGRQALFDWVAAELRWPANNALVLFGQRRIGKTSFLLQLLQKLPTDAFFPVYFNLQDQAQLPLNQVVADLSEQLAEEAGLASFAAAGFDEQGDLFRRSVLPQLYDALGERRPVFLFDEFDVLDQMVEAELPETTATKALFPLLRRIMSEDPRPAFVFVVGRRTDDLSLDLRATFKAALQREIWALDPESAVKVVRQAEMNGSLRFQDDAVARILKLTSSHPYLLQLLCQRIWERAHSDNETAAPSIGVAEVEAAVPEALEVGGQALEWLWDGLSPAEKIYASALAEVATEDEPISEDQVIEVLSDHAARLLTWEVEDLAPRELEKRKVLVRVDVSEYRFAVELLRRWIQKRKPLYEVKNELDRLEPVADQYFALGRRSLLQRNLEDAVDLFQRALKESSRHFRSRLYLGEALLKLGAAEKAVAELEKAYRLDREEARLPLARAWMARAYQLEEEGDNDEALLLSEQVLELSPREKDAEELRNTIWTARGHEAFHNGDFEGALAAFRRAGNQHLVEMTEIELKTRKGKPIPPKPRVVPRWLVAGVAIVVLAVALGYRWWQTRPSRPDIRLSVAVLSLENRSGRADFDWLSIAFAEFLRSYVAAGGEIRTVAGQRVAEVERDLAPGPLGELTPEERERLRLNLSVDALIGGAFEGLDEEQFLRLTVEFEDTRSGEVTKLDTRTGVVQQLATLVQRIGEPLRQEFGAAKLTPKQRMEVNASFPPGIAGRLYANGLASFWRQDFEKTSQFLAQAAEAAPTNPMPYVYLADTWLELEYPDQAYEAVEKAFERAGDLADEQRLAIEARLHTAAQDWEQAIAALREAYRAFPDDLEVGLRLATVELDAGLGNNALETLDDLQDVPGAAGNPRLALVRAWIWDHLADDRQALLFARDAAHHAELRGANYLTARARLAEGKALLALGDAEGAEAAYQAAIERFTIADVPTELARAYELKAEAVTWTDLDAARQSYVNALEIYRDSDNRKREAWVRMSLGALLLNWGLSDEAKAYFSEASQLFDELGALQDSAASLVNEGVIYHQRGELAEARSRYTKALAGFQDLGDEGWTAVVLTNIAEIHFLEGNLDAAQQLHREALAINEKLAEWSGQAYDTYRLGMVSVARGDWAVARHSYEAALSLQVELAEDVAAAETRLALAELALLEKDFAEAEKVAREAEDVLRTAGLDDRSALAQAFLARTLLVQEKTSEARHFVEIATRSAEDAWALEVRLAAAAVAARLQAAEGDPDGAIAALARVAAEASVAGRVVDTFKTRLVMSEIELDGGRFEAARDRLAVLRAEAEAKGVYGIVRQVNGLLTELVLRATLK